MDRYRTPALLAVALLPLAAAGESVWIEAESLADRPSAATAGGWGRSEWLSGGSLLAINLDGAAAATVPDAGWTLRYPFAVRQPGEFALWNRVVFENIRAPFEWRVDDGPWQANSQQAQPVANVQELAFWNPLGWTRMGSAALAAGPHALEIRVSRRPKDPADPAKGWEDLRYVSDAIHLVSDPWRPHFRHRPGEAQPDAADRAAAAHRFAFPAAPADAPRQVADLDGPWQFAPYDEWEEIPEESRVAGTDACPDPARLDWSAMPVPGDRNLLRPEARHVHRFVLRARVEVPAALAGAGFHLQFEALSMIASLFVNGRRIGDFSLPKSRWQADVTGAVRPGATNEILLVVKDTYYALAPDGEGRGMRRSQYYPEDLFRSNQGVTHRLDFPVAGHGEAGILDTVRLVATRAPVYVADTFAKPFPVTRQRIEFDVTLRNAGAAPAEAAVRVRARTWPKGDPVADLGERQVSVPAGGEAVAAFSTPSGPFATWEIDRAALHEFVAEVRVGGRAADEHVTRFGNREWEVRGNRFFLNGVARHLRADLTHEGPPAGTDLARIREDWRRAGMNMFRRRFQFPWNGLSPRRTLAWMDEAGMPVRMNGATFDGQVCSYRFAEGRRREATPRTALFDRWRAQMLNGVETFKNHPSVFLWELDNEIVYINGRNFGQLDVVEPQFAATARAVLDRDPTRVTVTGGGAALRDESLPVYGIHYYEVDDRLYPDEAYTGAASLALEGSGREGRVWPVRFDAKPMFFSETAFLPGRNPAQFAGVGGEAAFLGKREARAAAGLIAAWLAEGYRWKGYAGTHFWFARDFTDGRYVEAWQPVAILRREWNRTFAAGQAVTRSLRVYNDLPDARPIEASWTLEVGGKPVARDRRAFAVAPGGFEPWEIRFTLPARVAARTGGRLVLAAARAGETVFTRELPLTLHPDPKPARAKLDGDLVVWDPKGEALARLRAAGYPAIREVRSLAEVPDRFGLLVVGRDAVPAAESTDRRWQALAAAGNRILLLEQENPLHYQALPADLEPTARDGTIAFSQDLSHPAFAGLAQEDLAFWSGDHVVYRRAWRKPSRGAVSLAQCDEELGCTALAVAEVDGGLVAMCQLAVGAKLAEEVVARRLFDNLVAFAAGYRRVVRPVASCVREPQAAAALAGIGVRARRAEDPVAALRDVTGGLLVVDGARAPLERLAAEPAALEAFWKGGGWIVALAVGPEALPAFNRLVGYEHLLRPFREELVRFPAVRHPLAAGLTLRDVVMSSGRRIQTWNRDEWPASDAFDHIVDLDDIAPFAEFPPPAYWNDPQTKGPGDDTWPPNMVNGYTADTHWRMTFSIHLDRGDPARWTMKLPRPERVRRIVVRPTRTYHRISGYRVALAGDPAGPRSFDVDPAAEEHVLEFAGAPAADAVEFEIARWGGSESANVVGIGNLEILVERPADFAGRVRPLLNIGGLVAYPRGTGGVLLSQYAFRAREPNPVNAEKKRTVLATLLRNLGADFGGARTAIAGHNLDYRPVSLEGHANVYLTAAQGWPGRGGDLADLPRGEQTLAGVRYRIRDFATSPLESGVTLRHPQLRSNAAGESVEGIAVGGKADTLFFLHAFLQTRDWNPRREEEPPALFRYVVRYEDGATAPVEVALGRGVAHWRQARPAALAEAEVAWTGPASGGEQPTVYQFQWNNPRPDQPIRSVGLEYAERGRDFGAPLVLGISAATVRP